MSRPFDNIADPAYIEPNPQVTTCAEKDCQEQIWVAPWHVPLKIYCEEHRAIRADDAREEAFQDKINEAKEDER